MSNDDAAVAAKETHNDMLKRFRDGNTYAREVMRHRGPRFSVEYGKQLLALGFPASVQEAAGQLGIAPATLWKRIYRNRYKVTADILKPARKYVPRSKIVL